MDHFFKDFIMLWSTIDPVGTLALFTGLTSRLSKSQKRAVALKATMYAFVILLSALVLGQIILKAMNIQLISLQLAGGIILFLFGLQMIFSNPEEGTGERELGHHLAVFPLAVPSIASPGAIMAVILLTDNKSKTLVQQASTALSMTCVLAITCILMLLANPIFRVIGHNGSAIIIRVMGMILAALSVELVMNALGIQRWIH
ncbi:MarC family protein [Endozoicomonas ascidiicola]|uniref:MarC family protein n=1 Tax=Endozoicomonas ascidiicola TaxID=1698521 RepID=UPI000AB21960|nr:MarC family protein [Endozoicomonas ascidiicola]